MLNASAQTQQIDVDLSDLIEAIGNNVFMEQLQRFLQLVCGAASCVIGHDNTPELVTVGTIPHASLKLMEQRRDSHSIALVASKCEQRFPRYLASSRLDRSTVRIPLPAAHPNISRCLSIVSSNRHNGFTREELSRLHGQTATLASIAAKHIELTQRESKSGTPISSLVEIESGISESGEALSKREAEVCARILYGMSAAGIALDLGVGIESVTTYRKRAYHRLGIATQRELLVWYLKLRCGSNRCN
jgi:DNA-binding CsgD family transcriptional regulator